MNRAIAEIKFWWYWLTHSEVIGRLTILDDDKKVQIIYAVDETNTCIKSFWIDS